jgi:uncharacterized protein
MRFFSKRKDFLKMLLQQAEKTEQGLEALTVFISDPSPASGKIVERLEEEADEIRRLLVDELNQSFVTPIDREDIFSLSRAIDDMIDYAKSTVEEMLLFEVSSDAYMKKISEALYAASKDITAAVRVIKTHQQACFEHVIRAKKTENLIEHIYREGLAELFKNTDVVKILKVREIYRHLSNAADRGDEAANIIGDILVKMT